MCGKYKPGTAPGQGTVASSQQQAQSDTPTRHKRTKHQLPGQKKQHTSSQLSQVVFATPGDVVETPGASQDESISQDVANVNGVVDRFWTKAEMELRDSLPSSWTTIVNDSCHRRGFLRDLGEFKLPPGERQEVDKAVCCSACNPDLNPEITYPPDRPKALAAPRAGSFAAVVCVYLEAFAIRRAAALYCSDSTRFTLPAGAYMPQECRWELSTALVKVVGTRSIPDNVESPVTYDFVALCAELPVLTNWNRWVTEYDIVLQALPSIKEAADTEMEQLRIDRAHRRENSSQESLSVTAMSQVVDMDAVRRQQDDNAASVVAQEEAMLPPLSPPRIYMPYTPTPSSKQTLPQQGRSKRRLPLTEQTMSQRNMRPRRPTLATTPPPIRHTTPVLSLTPTRGTALGSRKRVLTPKGKELYGA